MSGHQPGAMSLGRLEGRAQAAEARLGLLEAGVLHVQHLSETLVAGQEVSCAERAAAAEAARRFLELNVNDGILERQRELRVLEARFEAFARTVVLALAGLAIVVVALAMSVAP